jgi:proteasome lid subunit RPN8/RPN11
MLILSTTSLQTILTHAEQTYPEECCGILLGQICAEPPQKTLPQKTLIEVIATQNAWDETVALELQHSDLQIAPSPYSSGQDQAPDQVPGQAPDQARRDRYWIDPRDLLNAQKTARSRSLQIIGIYHSHPDHPAVPSETDRVLAWATYSYLIVSVQQGKAVETLSWQLDSEHQFGAEAIEIRFK